MEQEFYADCGFYKDKLKGSITTLCGRVVGITNTDSGEGSIIDIETGLCLSNGVGNTIEIATKTMSILMDMQESKKQEQIKKFNNLPVAEPNKIVVRTNLRQISGMINYKYFNCNITDTDEGLRMELEESQLYTPEECNLIIDQIQELLAIK